MRAEPFEMIVAEIDKHHPNASGRLFARWIAETIAQQLHEDERAAAALEHYAALLDGIAERGPLSVDDAVRYTAQLARMMGGNPATLTAAQTLPTPSEDERAAAAPIVQASYLGSRVTIHWLPNEGKPETLATTTLRNVTEIHYNCLRAAGHDDRIIIAFVSGIHGDQLTYDMAGIVEFEAIAETEKAAEF